MFEKYVGCSLEPLWLRFVRMIIERVMSWEWLFFRMNLNEIGIDFVLSDLNFDANLVGSVAEAAKWRRNVID